MNSDSLAQAIGTGGQAILLVVVLLVIFGVLRGAIRAVKEYERLVIFFIGRFRAVRGPGLTFVIPFVEHAYTVDMRETIIDIDKQTAITKDNASNRYRFSGVLPHRRSGTIQDESRESD